MLANYIGGGGGNRTRGRAFAELGLTTWRPRLERLPLKHLVVLASIQAELMCSILFAR